MKQDKEQLDKIINDVKYSDDARDKRGLYYVSINEHKRMLVKPNKPKSYPHLKGFKGCRTPSCSRLTRVQLERQVQRWDTRLEKLDTNKAMLFITLTTADKSLSIKKFKKALEYFLTKVKKFNHYNEYIRRIGINGCNQLHSHIVVFFNSKNTPRQLTKRWVKQNWKLGVSCDCKKSKDYGELKGYLCKIDKNDIDKNNSDLTNYPARTKVISSSNKLEQTLDSIEILTDKNGVQKIKDQLNEQKLKEKNKNLSSYIQGHNHVNKETGELFFVQDKSFFY